MLGKDGRGKKNEEKEEARGRKKGGRRGREMRREKEERGMRRVGERREAERRCRGEGEGKWTEEE